MTIQEIKDFCLFIQGVTNSDRTRSAMVTAILYLTPNVPVRTTQWIVSMLRDLAVYADLYGDNDCANWLDDAADALRDRITVED